MGVQLQETRSAILRTLLSQAGPDGMRLKDITEALHLTNAATLTHLGILQRDGLIETKHEGPWGRGSRYWAKAGFQALWVQPGVKQPRQWSSPAPIDWRFPLVSRVPDAAAQDFLNRWFDLAQNKGKLPATGSKYLPKAAKPPVFQVVVYGSCARGDATPRSDLDILIFTELAARPAGALVDLAHETSLQAKRSPDIRTLDQKGWAKADAPLRANVRSDGITVYSNRPDLPFFEDTTEAK